MIRSFPRTLQPTATEQVTLLSGKVVDVPKARPVFTRWSGSTVPNTYGKKQVIDANGEALFAELAILRLFQAEGWDGVWIDTYSRRNRIAMNKDIALPEDKAAVLQHIYDIAGAKAGCFDVFCWKHDSVVFAEGKRQARDRMQQSQIRWFTAALEAGLPLEAFLIVE